MIGDILIILAGFFLLFAVYAIMMFCVSFYLYKREMATLKDWVDAPFSDDDDEFFD